MRKRAISIDEVKASIHRLVGQQLKVSVNKGRKRIIKYDGEIVEIYPSVFVLKILGDRFIDKLSCSYSDVICGDIALKTKRIANAESIRTECLPLPQPIEMT